MTRRQRFERFKRSKSNDERESLAFGYAGTPFDGLIEKAVVYTKVPPKEFSDADGALKRREKFFRDLGETVARHISGQDSHYFFALSQAINSWKRNDGREDRELAAAWLAWSMSLPNPSGAIQIKQVLKHLKIMGVDDTPDLPTLRRRLKKAGFKIKGEPGNRSGKTRHNSFRK